MTPDGLPALTVCVSEICQRPLAMVPVGMFGFPFLPADPFLLPDPRTLPCRAGALPFALPPCPFLPTPSPASHSLVSVRASLCKALLDPGGLGCGCEGGHRLP